VTEPNDNANNNRKNFPLGKPSQNDDFYDDTPIIEGWMNFRTAVRLEVHEHDTHYTITTRLYRIFADSLRVWLQGMFLFIEAQIEDAGDGLPQRARFVRNVPLIDVDARHLTVRYMPHTGDLIIYVPKNPKH
jgi:hypothetical protein